MWLLFKAKLKLCCKRLWRFLAKGNNVKKYERYYVFAE